MIKKSILIAMVIGLFMSSSVMSEVFGSYKKYNSTSIEYNHYYKGSRAFEVNSILAHDFPHLANTKATLCTDTHSRKVAGVIIDDKCVVEWSGRISANEDFYVLIDIDTMWEPLYQGRKLSGMEITNGGWDKDEYVYHCLIQTKSRFGKEIYIKTLGKYIPNKNACYTSQNYRFKKVTLDNNNYNLSVLVKQD